MPFNFKNGDRPLDGYTIQHALGRGGFGEVYFAISDSGREVALKAVQNFEDVELRGISHCMNLKSPHLVMIFDVRRSENGTPWVIMEYVNGSSLRDILDESPQGLDVEQTRFFMRELCKGLNYLHEAGVVHRDLKPHNVFFEDGIVKIGDYSLSKVITASHRSGNTMTVGSVHYMAPEISMGRYDKTVDIYALGCMLYEMLTGQPPFTGESMGEVLMKHLSQQPVLDQIPEPFAAAVAKAMLRNPEQRFQTAREFADAMSESVAVPLDSFHPASLSLVGQRTREARRIASTQVPQDSPLTAALASPAMPNVAPTPQPKEPSPTFESTAPTVAGNTRVLPKNLPPRSIRKISAMQKLGLNYVAPENAWRGPDSLHLGWRVLLIILTSIAGTALLAALTPSISESAVIGRGVATVIFAMATMLIRPILRNRWLSRVIFAGMAFMCGASLQELKLIEGPYNFEALAFGMAAGAAIPDWRCLIAPDRPKRIMVGATWIAGAIAAIIALVFGVFLDDAASVAGTLMLIAVSVQLAVPLRLETPIGGDSSHGPIGQVSALLGTSMLGIVCELVMLCVGIAIFGMMIEGDDDLWPVAIASLFVGYLAFRIRVKLPRKTDSAPMLAAHPVLLFQQPLVLEMLVAFCLAATFGFLSWGEIGLMPAVIISGTLTLFFGRLRWFSGQIVKYRQSHCKTYQLDHLACMCELVIAACGTTVLCILPWLPYDDELIVPVVIALAVGAMALRLRLTRNILHDTSL